MTKLVHCNQLVELKVIESSSDLNKLHEDFARYESAYTAQSRLWDSNIPHQKEDLLKALVKKELI